MIRVGSELENAASPSTQEPAARLAIWQKVTFEPELERTLREGVDSGIEQVPLLPMPKGVAAGRRDIARTALLNQVLRGTRAAPAGQKRVRAWGRGAASSRGSSGS